jgi:hypothetical protein
VEGVPRVIPCMKRFSSSACALSAAEGLIMMSESPSESPTALQQIQVPTGAVYCPSPTTHAVHGHPAPLDSLSIMKMFTARNNELLSPHLRFWPNLQRTEYARVTHVAILPYNCPTATLQDCLLVWFAEECMDVRPVTALARKLGLCTTEGAPVQGPVVVCTFRMLNQTSSSLWYGAGSRTIYGAGEWVHVPTLSECVRRLNCADSAVGVLMRKGSFAKKSTNL